MENKLVALFSAFGNDFSIEILFQISNTISYTNMKLKSACMSEAWLHFVYNQVSKKKF